MGAGRWLEMGPFRTQTVPKSTEEDIEFWFAVYSAGCVFLLPFVTILYRNLGFNEKLIGVICALRPFVSAASGSLVVSAADATQRHLAILLAVYAVAWLGRSLMASFTGFAVQLALAMITEGAAAPMGALVDAAVSASATDDGGYGRIRMWASVGWGGAAPIAGAVVGAYGLKAAFLCFTALCGLMLVPTALLPVEALAKKHPAAEGGPKGLAETGGQPSRQGSESGGPARPRLSTLSDKMGCSKERRGSLGDGEHTSLLSVHVTGGSRPVLLAPGKGPGVGVESSDKARLAERASAPVARIWTIGSGIGEEAPADDQPPVFSVVADGRATACHSPAWGDDTYSLLPSPKRPLLAATSLSSVPTSPVVDRRTGDAASPLEIAAAIPASRPAGGATAARDSVSVWQGVKGLLADVHVLVFFLLALLMGIGNGAIGYLFLFLDELGASGTLMGLCLSCNCAAEVPVFFFSGPILKRLGVARALQAAMGAYVIRLCCYLALPLLPTPWLVLPVELLQGMTFALAWAAGTVHVKRIAPAHLRGTVQSIFAGLYTGVGAGLGGLAGGLLYGSLGAAALFRTAALTLGAGWLAANVVLHFWGGGAASAAAGKSEHGFSKMQSQGSSEEEEGAALLGT